MKVIAAGLGCFSFGAMMMSSVVDAQPVTFEQQIEPAECIYTSITTGGAPSTATNCDNQPLPVVTTVTVHGSQVTIIGHFVAADTRVLRVWIAGQAYVLGIDSSVTAVGDTWVLNLQMLHTGKYAVTLEAETNNNYLLRNVDAATFTITTTTPPLQPNTPGGVIFDNDLFTIPALPGAGDQDMPNVVTVPSPVNDNQVDHHTSQNTLTELAVAAFIIIPLAAICIGLIIRSRKQ